MDVKDFKDKYISRKIDQRNLSRLDETTSKPTHKEENGDW